MIPVQRTFAVVVLALAALAFGGAVREPAPLGVVDLERRLAALDGTGAMRYFELAEEIAFELPTPEAQRLARQLYVHAYEIAQRERRAPPLGRSVCLALAEIVEPAERRWLLTLAAALSDRGPAEAPEEAALVVGGSDAAAALAALLDRMVAGDARELRDELLRLDPDAVVRRGGGEAVTDAIAYAERLLVQAGIEEVDARRIGRWLAEAIDEHVCTRCRNDRVIRLPGEDGMQTVLCDRCGGDPGIDLERDELLLVARAQALLVGAEPSGWGAQAYVTGGRPLRDVDLAELRAVFGVDPAQPAWQAPPGRPLDGRWVAPPPVSRGS